MTLQPVPSMALQHTDAYIAKGIGIAHSPYVNTVRRLGVAEYKVKFVRVQVYMYKAGN